MNAKVALNTTGLKPREKLAKYQKAITQCGAVPALTNPTPTLIVCAGSHDAANDMLDLIDTKEQELTNLRVQREQLMDTAMGHHSTLGSCVETQSLGDPAFITAKGYDVAGTGTPPPPVGQLQNLVLTHGDTDGAVDVSWNRDKSSRSTEVQTSPDPMTDHTWVPNQIAPQSSCTILNQVVGSKLWVRVRAIGKDGPGLWSEPAFIIVS